MFLFDYRFGLVPERNPSSKADTLQSIREYLYINPWISTRVSLQCSQLHSTVRLPIPLILPFCPMISFPPRTGGEPLPIRLLPPKLSNNAFTPSKTSAPHFFLRCTKIRQARNLFMSSPVQCWILRPANVFFCLRSPQNRGPKLLLWNVAGANPLKTSFLSNTEFTTAVSGAEIC